MLNSILKMGLPAGGRDVVGNGKVGEMRHIVV